MSHNKAIMPSPPLARTSRNTLYQTFTSVLKCIIYHAGFPNFHQEISISICNSGKLTKLLDAEMNKLINYLC